MLDNVSLTVRQGELVVVTGPSGSGKSTLLHVVGGLLSPDSGRIRIEGNDLAALTERDLAGIRRRRISFVFQFFHLLDSMSALQNVAMPLLLDKAPDAARRARNALDGVGMADRVSHKPSALSGGERQRVAIARAIVTKPGLVLADEPTGNLDSSAGAHILDLLRAYVDQRNALVLVSHDPEATRIADRVIKLQDGRLAT